MRKATALISIITVMVVVGARAGAYELYFGGTHSHTSFSDGKALPENAYDTARYQGAADFWFVTDHYHSLGRMENAPDRGEWDHTVATARARTEPGKFVALVGWEWADDTAGHMNVLFDAETPPPMLMTSFFDRFVSYWLKNHRDTVTGFNHPYWSSEHRLNNFKGFEFIPQIASQTVYMEVSEPGDVPYYWLALDHGWWVAPVAAQDNHAPDWGVRPEFAAVYADELTAPALLEAFRARRVYSTTHRPMRLWFEGNGNPMGARFKADSVTLDVKVACGDGIPPAFVRIVSNGGQTVREWKPESAEFAASVTVPIEYDGRYWFAAWAQTADGKFSISAPVIVARP